MRAPTPRGPLTAVLLDALVAAPGPLPVLREATDRALRTTRDVLDDDDIQLALFVLYELHYRGIGGVDDIWEWHPELLAVRAELEREFEARLRLLVPVPDTPAASAAEVAEALFELTAADEGPSLSGFVAKRATVPAAMR